MKARRPPGNQHPRAQPATMQHMRQRAERPRESRIEMIPLIDVVFLVLASFIYASLFTTYKIGLSLELPQATQASVETAPTLTLTIEQGGSLFLERQPIGRAELERELGREIAARPGLALFVIADRGARVETLVQVMDLGQKLGIEKLTVATAAETGAGQRP